MLRMWKFLTLVDHRGTHKPYICCICDTMVTRVDNCLKRHGFKGEDLAINVEKSKCLTEQFIKEKLQQPVMIIPSHRVIDQQSECSSSILKHAVEFDRGDKRMVTWRIRNSDFKHYYDSYEALLNDFETYQIMKYQVKVEQAKQNKEAFLALWKCVDLSCTMYPENALADANKIEDRCIFPKISSLVKYNNLTSTEKEQVKNQKRLPIQANTIKNRISLFERVLDFLEARQIFAGIHSKCFTTLRARCL